MRGSAIGLLIVGSVAGCYSEPSYSQSTFPEPYVAGPPGGGMDPSTGYEQSGYPNPEAPQGYPAGYPEGYPPATESVTTETNIDFSATGTVDDPEIDTTLQPYGEWITDDSYGRVWRPYATVVGVDFTPYETCGSWVNSDQGWAFDCDWSWGWLPFHYGRWGWFDDGGYWGWVPGHEWTPAAVEWRHGNGYVGWRPLMPERGQLRDHRGEHTGPTFHDHRGAVAHDSHWRFSTEGDFAKPHIHAHELRAPAEGLRTTAPVAQLPFRGAQQIRAADLMHARVAASPNLGTTNGGRPVRQPAPMGPRPESATWQRPPVRTYQPPAMQSYRPAVQSYRPPVQSYQQGFRQPYPTQGYRAPVQTYQPPARYQQPMRSYQPSPQSYRAPSPGPSHSSYSAPSQSSYSAPSHSSYSAPSHSSYSAPSHSSSGGGGHSGGGHHR
ncbi:MAG: hypothetical protein JWO36_1887 [Myxococcales bacterium]|nr:hypothetical protein [Myxococcales bacterium]